MKGSSRRISTTHSIVCPRCEIGEVSALGSALARCDFCGRTVDGTVLESLQQIVSLPEAIGSHACEECGHPEMRRLPDAVYWCPACGSEVLPPKPSWAS
jgi:ribosomal protein L37AE/L43A